MITPAVVIASVTSAPVEAPHLVRQPFAEPSRPSEWITRTVRRDGWVCLLGCLERTFCSTQSNCDRPVRRFASSGAAIVALGAVVRILARKLAEYLMPSTPESHASDIAGPAEESGNDLAPMLEPTQEAGPPMVLKM